MGIAMFGAVALGFLAGGAFSFFSAGGTFFLSLYLTKRRRLVAMVVPLVAVVLALALFPFVPHEFYGAPTGGEDYDVQWGNLFVMFGAYAALPGIAALGGGLSGLLCPRNESPES